MPQGNDEDLALCRRAAAGDRAAFGMLVAGHERPLRAFLARVAGPDLAEDLAQEAFLKAWRFADRYDGLSRYSTWLTRIAWRCFLDGVRKRRPPADASEESLHQSAGEAAEVGDMLARLGQSERAALVLCEGHGWSHAEAAGMLGMPLGTLKSTVARAKAKCRAMWVGEGQ